MMDTFEKDVQSVLKTMDECKNRIRLCQLSAPWGYITARLDKVFPGEGSKPVYSIVINGVEQATSSKQLAAKLWAGLLRDHWHN